MQILNLGCGAVRPGEPFTNVDSLRQILHVGTPERAQLDSEPNYVEADLRDRLPFAHSQFNGVLASHVLEHFDAISGVSVLRECHRVLCPGGCLLVSVPDASYHRSVYPRDCKRNCMELFGEAMPQSEPKKTFLDYALFFSDHRMVFTEDSLWAILVQGGFQAIRRISAMECAGEKDSVMAMFPYLNRRKFSLVMVAEG